MNKDVKAQVMELFEPDLASGFDNEEDRLFYEQRVCTLHEFIEYVPDAKLQQRGGSALLPTQMSQMLGPEEISELKKVADIPTAELSKVSEWNTMIKCIVIGVAGVTQYLADTHPEDLDYTWLR